MTNNCPTILIVDDNESNIHILFDTLENYDLIPALDGKSALDIIKEEKIDLILLDIMMPEINGFDVCKIIKSDPQTSDIPIIFLTGKLDTDYIKKGFELGAIDYITKPFQIVELKARINNHLELINYKKSLEKRVEEEIVKNKVSQQILFQQSKQAEFGELLMHIAHQWKQPLSELGSINTFQTAKLELNKQITNDDLRNYLQKSGQLISFMSDTIETFQNFYRPNRDDEWFFIKDSIYNSLNIISATLDYNNIKFEINIEQNYKLFGNKNEFSQIILSLLNNSKNIFIKRNIENRKINIKVSSDNILNKIIIHDNAGGFENNLSNDIFKAFVSFSDSTGMGLYMVKTICEKNNWNISVKNENDGAQFTIKTKR